MKISANREFLRSVLFCEENSCISLNDDSPIIIETMKQLDSYFKNPRFVFQLPLEPASTAFQANMRNEMMAIGPGQTRTYGEIARRIGSANSSRAVGRAAGANPFMIVVPCHRVVGSNGSLTGYAGGIERKKWLLEHERQGLF
jgi:methylated-DNA-[protein]-cysteine S-methyltransferase